VTAKVRKIIQESIFASARFHFFLTTGYRIIEFLYFCLKTEI